jgi:hypothetical protein
MMGYRISGLPLAEFEPLFGLDDEALKARNVSRVVADSKPGFPCRVTLEDAEPGETLLLLNHEHQAAATPYRSGHAIFVREAARSQAVLQNQVPPVLVTRLLSVRAFDRIGMMVDADCTEGAHLQPVIERLFADARTAYLHVHNAKRGCFAARVDRLGDTRRRRRHQSLFLSSSAFWKISSILARASGSLFASIRSMTGRSLFFSWSPWKL